MKISASLPTGVAALLFEGARRRRDAEERLAGLLRNAGYEEAILPILDYVEPYEALLTPSRRGELYRFIDRDGELLALRADFTPMLARLLAPRIQSLPLPLRVFYRGDVVRYEEERAGHQRELYQLGAELLGLAGEPADREILTMFLDALTLDSGGNDSPEIQVVLGFAGALDRLLLEAGADNAPALAAAVGRRERSEVRRTCGRLLAVVETGLPERPEELGEEAAGRLRRLLALRDELAGRHPRVRLHVDLAEFAQQGLDPALVPDPASGDRPYYDGLVFRAYAGASALPVGGGGRYDRLFRDLGAEVPAIGFSVSLDRLLEARP